MEIKVTLNGELDKKARVVQKQRGNDIEQIVYQQVNDYYKDILQSTNSKYIAGQLSEQEYLDILGDEPSQRLKAQRKVADDNAKKLILHLKEELFPFGDLDLEKAKKESFALLSQKTPVEEAYEEYIQATHWSEDEYETILNKFKELKEIELTELDIFPRRIKLFRMLDFMKGNGDIYEYRKHLLKLIE